ncbi:RIP metalloprotease RseP [Thiomicrospira sp. WB1]|nr:RIP metalloprotease RseP [Thiomicrospira sp. WB1]
MTFFWSVLGFVVAIGVLVTVHEWGHYAMARLFNIKVTHFSIGFGKPLWSYQGRETRFQVSAIPLGGYVRFADERVEPVASADLTRAFNRQSVFKRFAVVAAGPLINLLFAWWVFALMFASGVSGLKPVFVWQTQSSSFESVEPAQQWLLTEVGGQPVKTWREAQQQLLQAVVAKRDSIDLRYRAFDRSEQSGVVASDGRGQTFSLKPLSVDQLKENGWRKLGVIPSGPDLVPVLNQISPESPASKAGLQAGDRIVSISGQSVESWQVVTQIIRNQPGETVSMGIDRAGQRLQKQVALAAKPVGAETIGFMGASVKVPAQIKGRYQSTMQVGVWKALSMGWQHNLDWIAMSLSMLKGMVMGDVNWSNLSGPVSIAEFSGKAMQSGWVSFLGLLGLLSLSLGILNLLPIPLLDGGHLVFYLIEMLKGTPVSEGVEIASQKIGLFLILGLTFFALFNDVVRLTNG